MKLDINPADFNVLVVDDEESIREFLTEVIGEWGFQVENASDGQFALEKIQKGNIPHVIMTDINMPRLSGISLARRAKEIDDEIEVIIMTANASLDSAVEAIRIGVHDYLMKPFENLDDVKNVLTHVCERVYLKLYNEFLLDELKNKNVEIEKLSEMGDKLASVFDLGKTIEIGCEYISQVIEDEPVLFMQYIPKEKALLGTTRFPLNLLGETQPKYLLPDESLKSVESVNNLLMNMTELDAFQEFLKMTEKLDKEAHFSVKKKWKAFPFITRSLPRGIFLTKLDEAQETEMQSIVLRYKSSLEKYFENALLHKKVVDISIKDGLTDLFNVRHFKEQLEVQVALSIRHKTPLSFMFFDIDHFKKYNDTHGHPAGDLILKSFSKIMKERFRATDIVARYGGEEFVVLMPQTDIAHALEKAEFFRALIEKTSFPNEETQPLGKLTVSIGVSSLPKHASNSQDLIQVADDALYRAKKTARNMVSEAEAPESFAQLF